MATFCVFARADAPKFAKLLMFLFDLPQKGTHVGGGIHVNNDAPPPNPAPREWLGWCTRAVPWIAKPTNTGAASDEFAVRVTQDIQDRWQAKKSQLTPAQRTFVQSHLDSAADLAADWKRDVLQPGGGTISMLVEDADVEPDP